MDKDLDNYLHIEQGDEIWECKRCGCAVSNPSVHNLRCAGALPFDLSADEVRFNTWSGSNEVQALHLPTGHVAVGEGGDYLQNKFDALFEIASRLRS